MVWRRPNENLRGMLTGKEEGNKLPKKLPCRENKAAKGGKNQFEKKTESVTPTKTKNY